LSFIEPNFESSIELLSVGLGKISEPRLLRTKARARLGLDDFRFDPALEIVAKMTVDSDNLVS